MSDTFNHLHYLDKKLLEESPIPPSSFSWENILLERKKIFKNFSFIVVHRKTILFIDKELSNSVSFNENGLVLDAKDLKIFTLYLHEFDYPLKDTISLTNSILIQENISLNKSSYELHLSSQDKSSYYLLSQHSSNQLFHGKLNISVKDTFNSYFIQNNFNQKQKTETRYYLDKNSQLEHKSFANIQYGQLQDESIEIFHQKNSSSKILFDSLNKGKLASQINSVIGKTSENCETHQLLSHLVLDENAQTFSKPNLMIANPNVVASHGNSIGSFNSEAIFYLQQRGIDKNNAQRIIAQSKIANFINTLPLANEISMYLGVSL